jgi:AhpD family alkylhydroperoxidase
MVIATQTPSNMQKKPFNKRALNWKSFLNLINKTLRMLSFFISLGSPPKLKIQFQERIILAVTSVNDCKYCSFFHSKMAIEHGCKDEEINAILQQDLNCVDPYELPALAFAQHFAESHENPSKSATRKLLQIYGTHRTKQIIASCMMISWGNLLGNTIDAYHARRTGQRNNKNGQIFETLLYYLSIKFTPNVG